VQERKGLILLIHKSLSTNLFEEQKLLINKLKQDNLLSKEDFLTLLQQPTEEISEYLFSLAREVRKKIYGNDVYIRGLIEFTNYCKNDCYYCGIGYWKTKS